MAYAITFNNSLLNIAANETEKNELTALNTPHTVIEISDEDFDNRDIKFVDEITNFVLQFAGFLYFSDKRS